MSLPWFRMYSEAVDDEKLRLLAFQDRWHFVALLCLKAQGTLDSEAPNLERRLAMKLGLQVNELDEVKRRLFEVGLIDEKWQPLGWSKRQFFGDHSAAERMRKYREKHKNVTVTSPLRLDQIRTDQNRSEQKEAQEALSKIRQRVKALSGAKRLPTS